MKITVSDQSKYINVGSPSFLYAFFSTIVCKVPANANTSVGINFLKTGAISAAECEACAKSFEGIRKELSAFPRSEIIWNEEEPSQQPPWGDNISSHITSLGNYFVTADGKDLISELILLLQYASEHNLNVYVG